MKKLIIVLSFLISTNAYALDISTDIFTSTHFYEDFDVGQGIGVRLIADDVVENISLEGSVEYVSTSLPVSSTTIGGLVIGPRDISVDIVDLYFGTLYKMPNVAEKLDLYVGGGIDFYFIQAGSSFTAENEVGGTIKGVAKYKASETVSIKGELGYKFLQTDFQGDIGGSAIVGPTITAHGGGMFASIGANFSF